MSGSNQKRECYLCGAVAVTKDHVPPKGLFPKPRPNDLVTVPACLACNHNSALDDEYFRLAVLAGSCDSPQSTNVLNQRIIPRLNESPALILAFLKSVRRIDVHDRKGSHIGQAPAFSIDRPRIQAVISKIVRGLYFKHTKQRLPADYIVEDFLYKPQVVESLQDAILKLPLIIIGDGSVFSYSFHLSDINPFESFWFLMFYDDVSLFITRTTPASQSPITPPAPPA